MRDGEPQPHEGGFGARPAPRPWARGAPSDSSGSNVGDRRHDRPVSAMASVSDSASGWPTRTRDLRRVAHQGEVGRPGRAGPHLLGAPQPDRDDRGAGRRRPAGPSPSCPCSIGIEERITPRDRALRQHDHHLARPQRRFGRPQRLVRAAAPVDRDAPDGPGDRCRPPGRRRSPSCPGTAPGGRARAATRASAATSK